MDVADASFHPPHFERSYTVNTPKIGDKVYVSHLTVIVKKDKFEVKATVRARQFTGTIKNYLDQFGLRWRIAKIGTPVHDTSWAMAYKPERVYGSREEAQVALNERANQLINEVRHAVSRPIVDETVHPKGQQH